MKRIFFIVLLLIVCLSGYGQKWFGTGIVTDSIMSTTDSIEVEKILVLKNEPASWNDNYFITGSRASGFIGGQPVTPLISSPTATEIGYSVVWSGTHYTLVNIAGGGGGTPSWGGIIGTLSNQSDLYNYLDSLVGANTLAQQLDTLVGDVQASQLYLSLNKYDSDSTAVWDSLSVHRDSIADISNYLHGLSQDYWPLSGNFSTGGAQTITLESNTNFTDSYVFLGNASTKTINMGSLALQLYTEDDNDNSSTLLQIGKDNIVLASRESSIIRKGFTIDNTYATFTDDYDSVGLEYAYDYPNLGNLSLTHQLHVANMINDSLSAFGSFWPLSGSFSTSGDQTITLGGQLLFDVPDGSNNQLGWGNSSGTATHILTSIAANRNVFDIVADSVGTTVHLSIGVDSTSFEDNRTVKRGIEYASSGYVTQPLSLATKEYVDATVSGGVWGTITGTLSSQTDLQAALDAKISKTGLQTITETWYIQDNSTNDIRFLINTGETGIYSPDGIFGFRTEDDGNYLYKSVTLNGSNNILYFTHNGGSSDLSGSIEIDDNDQEFIFNDAASALTNINIASPTADDHAATKGYVDGLNEGIRIDTVHIGAWDMDANATTTINLPTTRAKIVYMMANIVHDNTTSNTFIPNVNSTSDGSAEAGFSNEINGAATTISLFRVTGSRFDSTNYNDTGINRGFVTIMYIE